MVLEKLTYGGDAMGRLPDGRVVFVPFALPGERVRLRITESRSKFARAEITQIVQASPARIVPRCKHYGRCGGCHYQHMDYNDQLRIKTEILRDQLKRIGRITEPPVRDAIPSPKEWSYRNHAQFHIMADGRPGFIAAGSGERGIAAIDACPILDEHLADAFAKIPGDAAKPGDRVALRSGSDGQVVVVPDRVHAETEGSKAESNVIPATALSMQVLDRTFRVSPESFFQVNTAMAAVMVEQVLAALPEHIPSAVDAFCGVGLFTAFLAPRCEQLVAIESSQTACRDFLHNMREFNQVRLIERPVEEALERIEGSLDAIVLDPPRAGLGERVVAAVADLAPVTIAYVSCDPATLARDAAGLIAAGYQLEQVTPIDLFPQTYHIESISIFKR